MVAECTAEDIVDDDGRILGNIYYRAAGDTLIKAAAVSGTHPAAQQIDDGRGLVEVESTGECLSRCIAHAQTVVGTSTEDLCLCEVLDAIGDVDEHVTVILQLVAVAVARCSFSGTKDSFNRTAWIVDGSDINESIAHIWLVGNTVVVTSSYLVCIVGIIIVTEAATENIPYPTLGVLHVRRNLIVAIYHVFDFITDTRREVCLSHNPAAQVITTIDMVADPREAVPSDIGFRVSENIGIAGACKGVEDTPVVEIDLGVASNQAFESATIDELTLSHVGTVAFFASFHTG